VLTPSVEWVVLTWNAPVQALPCWSELTGALGPVCSVIPELSWPCVQVWGPCIQVWGPCVQITDPWVLVSDALVEGSSALIQVSNALVEVSNATFEVRFVLVEKGPATPNRTCRITLQRLEPPAPRHDP
jgi:hypothetical protein